MENNVLESGVVTGMVARKNKDRDQIFFSPV